MRFIAPLSVSLVTLLAPSASPGAAASEPPAGRLEVVTKTRNERGLLGCALFASARGFPGKPKLALLRTRVAIPKGGAVSRRFEGVKPGTYAVAIHHDENSNGRVDTNWVGVPKEGYGASRDAKPGAFSPPKFQDAKFAYSGRPLRMRLLLRY